jgi:hypothetical protein
MDGFIHTDNDASLRYTTRGAGQRMADPESREQTVRIFEPGEGGSHRLALENPARFNRLPSEFVVAGAPNTTDPRPSPVNPTPRPNRI